MSSILVSYPSTPLSNKGSTKRSPRGRNAATQAPGDSMRIKSIPLKNVTNSKGLSEKESDFDSNYQSSDKSSPESPRPFSSGMGRSKRGDSPYGSNGVERKSSWSCSDSETPPTSAKSGSSASNRVTVEIGGTNSKIYHIPVGEIGNLTSSGQESILDVTMIPAPAPSPSPSPMLDALSPEEAERKRASRQRTMERCSLMALIPALLLLIICPWFMLPIFTIPNPHTYFFKIAILAGTPLGVLFLAIGCLLGNIIWYYDSTSGKMKWFVNCGGKVKDHYWGYDLFNGFPPRKKKSFQQV